MFHIHTCIDHCDQDFLASFGFFPGGSGFYISIGGSSRAIRGGPDFLTCIMQSILVSEKSVIGCDSDIDLIIGFSEFNIRILSQHIKHLFYSQVLWYL